MQRVLSIVVATVLVFGCDSEPKFQTSEDGVEYKMHVDEAGNAMVDGDLMVLKMNQFIGDSLTFSTPSEYGDVIDPNTNMPDAMKNILKKCSPGDSVEFKMTLKEYVDLTGGYYPPGVDSTDVLTWSIKVNDVGPQEELMTRYRAKQDEMSEMQFTNDVNALKEYAVNNNLEYQETEEGILYVVLEEGDGTYPQLENTVFVNYVVKRTDGVFIDTSYEDLAKENDVYNPGRTYEPISFVLGGPGIIQGWNIGIPKFSKGGKGRLLVPSKYAYGDRARGALIPANTNLVFDIEVVDFN